MSGSYYNQDCIRIIVIDDRKLVRESLKFYFETEPDIDIVGYADNGATGIKKIQQMYPDVAIVDLEMPDMNGVDTIVTIRENFPGTKVLVLSGHEEAEYIHKAIKAGAKGYLLKGTAPEDVANGIRYVNRGYSHLGPGLLEKIALSTLDRAMIVPQEKIEENLQSSLQKIRWEFDKKCQDLLQENQEASYQQVSDAIDLKMYGIKTKQSELFVNYRQLERRVNLLSISFVFFILIVVGNMMINKML